VYATLTRFVILRLQQPQSQSRMRSSHSSKDHVRDIMESVQSADRSRHGLTIDDMPLLDAVSTDINYANNVDPRHLLVETERTQYVNTSQQQLLGMLCSFSCLHGSAGLTPVWSSNPWTRQSRAPSDYPKPRYLQSDRRLYHGKLLLCCS